MNQFRTLSLLCCAILLIAPRSVSGANITIDTVPVSNLGNGHDVSTGSLYGGVSHYYRVGTYEVTNAQYAAFLNAKAKSDPLELYNPNMDTNPLSGITRSGIDGSYTYSTKPDMANKPVNYVSWYDSIRFANWLHNGQGDGDTETGAYTLLGSTPTPSNGLSITRNSGATWFMTSEDEWYKAAYYQPAAEGGDWDDYWLFPTASNSAPALATANAIGDISNPGTNVANYDRGADWNSMDGNVTTVGSAGPLSRSFYGTSDQGGNVFEWNEALISSMSRGLRGGSLNTIADDLSSPYRGDIFPTLEDDNLGFRLATIPEPTSGLLAIIGLGTLWILRKRSR